MKGRIGIIFRKEVVDNLRDRRSVLSAFLTPLFLPLFLVALIIVAGKTLFVNPAEQQLIPLPVQGVENAPGLIAFLRQNGAEILPAPADPQASVRLGNHDVILIIPASYPAAFQSGNPAAVQLVYDSTRQSAVATIERTRTILSTYAQQIGALRLMARGINPGITNSMAVENIDVATPQSQTLIFLNMMPFFIIIVIFTGGMYVIIDTTAGERERGSLEPLLINPATREEFMLGKLLASLPFAVATLMIVLGAFYAAFKFIPLEKFTGFPMALNFSTLWMVFWISLPMILLASGLQIVIATFTHSFKEAQTYLAILPLIAGLPGAFLTFLSVKATVWTMLIPAFGQSFLINQVMRGEPTSLANILTSAISTLALSLILIWIAVRLYQSERVLFGR